MYVSVNMFFVIVFDTVAGPSAEEIKGVFLLYIPISSQLIMLTNFDNSGGVNTLGL